MSAVAEPGQPLAERRAVAEPGHPLAERRAVAALLVGGLALHVAHQVALLQDDPTYDFLHGNAEEFAAVARTILGGDLLAGREVFFYGPLYAYFLAACFAVAGETALWLPRFVQAAVGVTTAAIAWRATRRALGPGPALGTLALLLAFASGFHFEGMLVATTLSTFLLALSVDLLLRLWREGAEPELAPGRATALAFGAGAALGLCAWGRGNALLLLPLFVAWTLDRTWRRGSLRARGARPARRLAALAPAAAIAAGFLATVLPVTARNALVAGDRVLLVSQGGINLWIGNNPEAPGVFYLPRADGVDTDAPGAYHDATRRVAEAEAGRPLRPSEVDRHWQRRAVGWALAHPADLARVTARKIRLLLAPYEVPIHNDAQVRREWSWVTRLPLPGWGLLWPLALAGLVLAPWGRTRATVLATLSAAYAASVVLFFVCDRYRFPLVVLVAPFAGQALASLAGAARARLAGRPAPGGTRLLAAMAVLVVSAAVLDEAVPGVRWNPLTAEQVGRHAALEHRRQAGALERLGRKEEALVEIERAVAAAPGHLPSRLDQARLLAARGRRDEAAAVLRTLLKVAPDAPGARALLESVESAPEPRAP